MRPVRLYESSIPSGNAYKVSLLLAHLGIDVPVTELDILADPPEPRRPEYLAKNPNGRIPLLELDDGSYLAESYGIADIALYAYTHTAGALGFAIGPAVAGWLGRVRAQPRHIAIKADPERSGSRVR
jgi:glutathione S-transferase